MKRTIFLMLAVLLSTLSASASGYFKVNGIAYYYDTYYLGDATCYYVNTGSDRKNTISIPSRVTYNGYTLPVTKISSQAFKDYTNLTSISIPSTITSISSTAFSGCTGLTSVTFNATNCSSSSSDEWFQDCPLTSLVIGNDVKSIPGYLAYNQTKLKKVTIPNSVTSIDSGAFFACSNLKYMQLMCTTPPSISSNSIPSGTVILVPAGAYDAYKKDKNWSRYT